MRVSATEAKNRFGALCAQAKREPIFVEKAGQLDTVILSVEHYQALKSEQNQSTSVARRQAFENEYGAWLAAENARIETQGIPGSEWRPW